MIKQRRGCIAAERGLKIYLCSKNSPFRAFRAFAQIKILYICIVQ